MPDTVMPHATVDADLDRALEPMATANGMPEEAFVAEAEAGRLIDHREAGGRIRRVLGAA